VNVAALPLAVALLLPGAAAGPGRPSEMAAKPRTLALKVVVLTPETIFMFPVLAAKLILVNWRPYLGE